ncbi:DNA-binding helix-turn-helix protein [Marvinbryantia formatexigens DSM 14469]|uniref:DNA-binding helix-turn-helix protein n=2 Tax=Marvinbryantia TaxID=248744 RepID=C6LGD3_9FIRM|nr:helix-turn-helix transcriptional regulator [Marvinbryantia formatexigens]EET60497.1 DNA-binding helix-turn-helix protein [Marvinbryantia formatexigens DSM 14469]
MYDPDEACQMMAASIKRICRQRGISPYVLAKKAGISTSSISYLLNGRTRPQVYTVLLICNALGVTIGELFDGENRK